LLFSEVREGLPEDITHFCAERELNFFLDFFSLPPAHRKHCVCSQIDSLIVYLGLTSLIHFSVVTWWACSSLFSGRSTLTTT